MNFVELLEKTSNKLTHTENGARAVNTTDNANLDLFATIGALRTADEERIKILFEKAYEEDSLSAVKILFYARDIREGLGERRVFQILLKNLAEYHPEAVIPNIAFIGEYGRFDDWYYLIGTPAEEAMWTAMKRQLLEDLKNFQLGKPVSLLAKWVKTADSKVEETRKLGILTAEKLGYPVYNFKRIIRTLRKYIDVTEIKMCGNNWDEIDYSAVPGRAMMKYRRAFDRHDTERFEKFINLALEGKENIHSKTLYPYDIVEKILYGNEDSKVLEAQWRNLPDYGVGDENMLIMTDVSGSMYGRPMATSIGLAIYFAERNKGDYHNRFMTFSALPSIVHLEGETLAEKVACAVEADWGLNTNLEAAFDSILKTAVENHVPEEEMPKSLIIISDMEFDSATYDSDWLFYETMKKKFKRNGYTIPNVVFWNVDSRHNAFHADKKREGVQLLSGSAVTIFEHLDEGIGMTPVEMMRKIIEDERYACITIAEAV